MPERIYLDYNATSPLRPDAREVMLPWLGVPANASSTHQSGRAARAAIEKARVQVAKSVKAEAANVVFTASATEANNQVLRMTEASAVFVSAIEHASVLNVAQSLKIPHFLIPVTAQGEVDVAALTDLLDRHGGDRPLVSVMLANNETGVIQPVQKVMKACRRRSVFLHCDAVQGFGKLSVDIRSLGVDALTLSAHKTGGPVGVGALVFGACGPVPPLLTGGGQESNRRAGTENVAAIAAFGWLAEHAGDLVKESADKATLREGMEQRILFIAPEARIFGMESERLPNTSCLTMPGVEAATQLMHFDLEGIEVSAGSACTSGKVGKSHVLAAMGIPEKEARCALRVSLGWGTTEEHIDRLVESWERLFRKKQS